MPRILPAEGARCEAWRPPAADQPPSLDLAAAIAGEEAPPDATQSFAPAAPSAAETRAAELAARQIFEDARARGLEEGRRAIEAERLAFLARLQEVENEINQERAEFFRRVEPEMVHLAVSIAEKVIGREVADHPDIVLDTIKRAMKRMQEKEFLRVRVHPDSLELVREQRDDLVAAVDGVQKLEIADDRRVDPGGCVIESRNGNVDARVGTQIREIERAVTGALEHAEPEQQTGPLEVPADSQQDGSG